MDERTQSGLMIGAPKSGSGKTIVTLGLLRAFHNRDLDIRAAKVGPDYIDPGFHQLASGSPSVNLDAWAMTTERYRQLARAQGGSHLLIESAMGLFDGSGDGSGSGADLAAGLGVGVLLVVDASSQSHSIAALVRGFRDHRSDVNVAGVILNNVASVRHEAMLRDALAKTEMPVLGAVERNERLTHPSRHLGLVPAREGSNIEDFIQEVSEIIDLQCDLDAIAKLFVPVKYIETKRACILPLGQNIAVARDEAFSFIYPHLINDWREMGANVSYFSPLLDEGPEEKCDAVYLPGGYPELHAGKLASADNFQAGMKRALAQQALIYGECGGYMVLGQGIVDGEGTAHEMLGMLNLETSFKARKLHLGYRRAKASRNFFAGKNLNVHEFHYSTVIKQEGEPLFSLEDALGEDLGWTGLRSHNVMGSYMHLIDFYKQAENCDD